MNGMKTSPTYVLVTPARNEAQFIELTIKSVVSQTVLPVKWVIASDGMRRVIPGSNWCRCPSAATGILLARSERLTLVTSG